METTRYRTVRAKIRNGDLVAVRGDNIITEVGRSNVRHVATAAWRFFHNPADMGDQNTLLAPESREWVGGRIVTLKSIVREFPGLVDIYSPNALCPQVLRNRAATVAVNWAGYGYDYPGIFYMGLWRLPFALRLARRAGLEPPDLTDTRARLPWPAPKVCSVLHAWAYRRAQDELEFEQARRDDPAAQGPLPRAGARWDPVPGRGDRWIEPADLVTSGSYELRFRGLVA